MLLQDHPHPTTLDAPHHSSVSSSLPATTTAIAESNNDALPIDAENATAQTPLMWRLCHEPYLTALRAFKTRTLYSNSENDSFVPFSTAALSRLNPVIGCDADTLAQYKPASYEFMVDVNAMLSHGFPKTASALIASASKDEAPAPALSTASSANNTDSISSIAARAKALGLGAVSTARPAQSSSPSSATPATSTTAAADAQDWPPAFAEHPIVRAMFLRLGGLASAPSSSSSSSSTEDASALRWRRFAILDRYFLPHFDGGDRWREVIRHIAESTLREHAAERRARIQREWQERPDAKPATPVGASAASIEAALRERSYGASRNDTPGPSEGSRGVGTGSAALQLHAMQLGQSLAAVKQ